MQNTLARTVRGSNRMSTGKPEDMAPDRQPEEPAAVKGQVNFKAPLALMNRLQNTAAALGLDVANLVRMIIVENLRKYEDRARMVSTDDASEK